MALTSHSSEHVEALHQHRRPQQLDQAGQTFPPPRSDLVVVSLYLKGSVELIWVKARSPVSPARHVRYESRPPSAPRPQIG